MKQMKLATSIFVSAILLSSSAALAQAPVKNELIPAGASHNWTGFYAGLNVGAVNNTMNITDVQATSFNSTLQQVSNPLLTGGFQAGYRRQLDLAHVSGVYGLEFDANFANATFNKEYGSPFALYQLRSSNQLKTVCLLELIGGIAADKTLLFLAAGLSWVNITGTTTNQDELAFFNSINVAKKQVGTALGAGIEYAFNEKISARIKVDVVTPNTYTAHDNVGDAYQVADNVVLGTIGINYKFA